MLGWSITVTAATPENYHEHLQIEPVIADWTVGPMGTRWIDALVECGDAAQVRWGGYPDIFTARASAIRPVLEGMVPPDGDDLTDTQARGLMIHRDRLSACPDGMMLTIVVWDQS